MCGDNELRAVTDKIMNARQDRKLSLRRKCGFGLVEDVDTVAAKSAES
ncbi:MAG: hypothetical protein QM785_13555 [Pyrinomonadaceae bacterium]